MPSEAALAQQYTNEDGKAALRLTPKGAQLGRAMAMSGEDVDAERHWMCCWRAHSLVKR